MLNKESICAFRVNDSTDSILGFKDENFIALLVQGMGTGKAGYASSDNGGLHGRGDVICWLGYWSQDVLNSSSSLH
jgi:hypothetical protein